MIDDISLSNPILKKSQIPHKLYQIHGRATYYNAAGKGACGFNNDENSFVVAISSADYDSMIQEDENPSKNWVCGRMVRVYHQNRFVDGRVVDRCPNKCESGDITLSPVMFDQLAEREVGEIPVAWKFL
ncbi:hypothetical protein G9A89_010938 [Geosiphon pyriformis]|nr:hypothetical protein G9A89_010938 [Geosiphon pyriformis]